MKDTLKLALEALESCGSGHITDGGKQWFDEKLVDKAYAAIEEVLSQPAVALEQRNANEHLEPVAFVKGCNRGQWEIFPAKAHQIFGIEQPLYTTPPQRTWVGLTDDEVEQLAGLVDWNSEHATWNFSMEVEAKLKEKNT